jgi:putative heme-binding domain-containing protein
MFGALYVVEDLEAYLADPEGYLESRPVPVADALLKDRRPRTAWKLEDLMPALADLERGRSFANGRQMFQVANCMACHRLDGLGSEFGPDLAARDPKLGPADVLKDVIEPSSRIHEKYPTYVVVTKEGQVMTAILLAETPQAVKLIENPLAGAQPKELPRSEIARLEKVPTSIMPQGLLDTLSRDEALDLLAFIIARGAKEHPYFKGHDGHEGH